MGGIGSGVNSGGFRQGSGRPKGARNRKALALIGEAERDDQLMPITFLLDTMRDVTLPLNTRLHAAALAAPFLHVKLTALRVTGDPNQLTDMQLLGQVAQLEEIVAAMPEPPPENPAPGAVIRPASEAAAVIRRPSNQSHPEWPVQQAAERAVPPSAPAPEVRRLRYDPVARKMVSALQ